MSAPERTVEVVLAEIMEALEELLGTSVAALAEIQEDAPA